MLKRPLRSRPVLTVSRYRTRPEVIALETRLALSVARPGLQAAAAAADVMRIRGSIVAGTLDIQGTSGADTVEIGRSARGFVTLTIDGEVRSGDLRDRGAFDRRLAGLRVDQIRSVRLMGDDPQDSVVLNTMLGTSTRPARIQSSAVAIAAPVSQAGTLRIDTRSITVSAAVRADAIVLSATGLLNLEAGGSLTATKSIDLKADRLIQTGNLVAPAVSMAANVIIRSGTVSASGGAVNVDFTENYVATEGAAIDVSALSGKGGSIRIDGGATGHLFNSGTLKATGKTDGGAVRVSGKDVVWIGGGADVSGGASGGLIQVGGGWQGSDASMTKARTLQVSPHTSLKADGGSQGGTVVLWSEEATTNYGTVSARGAKGGAVEVSSKASLAHGGAVDVGPGGKFLLDPKNIVIADSPMSAVPKFQLVNPTPNVNDNFGETIFPLSTGNVVVTDPSDDAVAPDAGAVYLYNGASGALISTLTGTTLNDFVGANGVTALSNGNYVVQSTNWNSNRGAATWGSGTVGVSGTVSAGNSLVGSTPNDQIGIGGVTALSNGNYVVLSSNWANGSQLSAGAVTWGNGTSGVAGVVSSANSLVGTTLGDQVGVNGVKALSNGNYVVQSQRWQGPTDLGAVTWGDGTVGVTGAVSTANSLAGVYNVTLLTNGNYVASSPSWGLAFGGYCGAVTWCSGTAPATGVVSAANSLVGATNDQVSVGGVTALPNGNYVVKSNVWSLSRGAFTWGSGTGPSTGLVTATNSLVGSTVDDAVDSVVTALSDGDYVIIAPKWDNGPATDAGAVTWGSGTAGVAGAMSSSISLVGSTTNDFVGGGGVTELTNGNYVVRSDFWDDIGAGLTDAGAVTWGNGATGVTGTITAGNSLISSTNSYQRIGSGGVTALTNGNYVVSSPIWNVGKGAVTWGNGATGVTGFVTAGNSVVGSTDNQQVGNGGVTALTNGNYVISSPWWNNNFGAVTWGDGSAGAAFTVSAANSLVGTEADYGGRTVKGLSSGNYVVISPFWDNGVAIDAGAVTWGSGTAGVVGPISSSNSLVGSTTNDQVGYGGVTELTNGNYVVRSEFWDNGPATDAGAVTWGSGTAGVTGAVSAANSLVGTAASSSVGSGGVTALTNGNYVVLSQNWDNYKGAATWSDGTSGSTGAVSAANSLVGSTPFSFVGNGGVTALSNGNFLVISSSWNGPTSTTPGALTWVSGTDGKVATGAVGGEISATNSFVNANGSTQTALNGNTFLTRFPVDGGSVYVGIQGTMPAVATFASNPSLTASMGSSFVAAPLNTGTATTLQANNDITQTSFLSVNNPSGNGGALTLQAGRSVAINNNITTDNGDLTLMANAGTGQGVVDAQRDAGAGGVSIAQGVSIDAGTGAVSLSSGAATGLTQRTSGGVSVSGNVTAASIAIATANSGSGAPDVSIGGYVNSTGAGGITINSAGAFSFASGGSLVSSASGAPITVTGTSLALQNSLETNGGNATFTGPATLTSYFSVNTGSGQLSFTNDLAVGFFAIVSTSPTPASFGGTLSLNGGVILASAGGIAVTASGSLTGNGTILGPVSLAGGLAPGSGASGAGVGGMTLSTSGLTLAGTATLTLNGTSKTAFDKIVTRGANLAGATLSLDLSAATLAAGDSITLIDNVSGSATAGTFAGLAQGAIFTASGNTMQISYTGGDGNDVVVTKVADITASFSVSRSGFFYLVPSDTYRQTITLTNVSPTAKKPRTFKFVGLPGEVSVVGGTQSGADWYLDIGDTSVPSAGSFGVPVQFVVPSGNAFTYTLEIIGG